MHARWLIVVGLFVGALVWLWRSTEEAPVVAEGSEPTVAKRTPTPRRTAMPEPPRATLTLPQRESAFDATSHHTADPCTALVEPIVPATFESITAAGITIAWDASSERTGPWDAPMRPTSLAFVVAGLLEEAAQLTGTERRQTLAVIVDGTKEEFQARTKTPPWVAGLYDGGAVHLAAKPNADLGVPMETLRHEVMHAQMHAAIGCTPFWFNEGLAEYFAGGVPTREWVTMLRGSDFDFATLRDPAIFDVKAESAQRMYAVSFAMVLFIVNRGGEVGIREVVRIARSADTIPAALDLWNRIATNVEYRAVLDSLALKIFGMQSGPELDAVVRGPVCCSNQRSPTDVRCHAQVPDAPRREICRRY